jgi:colicin import membrane protein
MKAALEAWGADSNLFHQGVAKESDDPDVVAATMSRPGVILRRPVGSDGLFGEHAELPQLTGDKLAKLAKSRSKSKRQPPREINDKAARRAALEFEKSQRQRESERRNEEATKAKERERREKAIAQAQAEFEKAKREHDSRTRAIEAERAKLEQRAQGEQDRWEKQKEKIKAALRRARD